MLPWTSIKQLSGFRAKPAYACARLISACCATLIFAAPARADHTIDHGGQISDYAGRIAQKAVNRERHVIAGDCKSACTMWLGYKGTCVMPDAVLWFHSASCAPTGLGGPWGRAAPSADGNQALLRMYPPRVRAVVAPWLQSREYRTLTGLELAALGVPLCTEKKERLDVSALIEADTKWRRTTTCKLPGGKKSGHLRRRSQAKG